MKRFILILTLVLSSSSASAQMSALADKICQAQCYHSPMVSLLIPQGEEPVVVQPVKMIDVGWGIELLVHSETNSDEWVAWIPLHLPDDYVFSDENAVRYGQEKCVGPADQMKGMQACVAVYSHPMTLEFLANRGWIELPQPKQEQTENELRYVLRVQWAKRDSGLNPFPKVKRSQLSTLLAPSSQAAPEITSLSQVTRTCASCPNWWAQWLVKNPDAWKKEKIELKMSDDFQEKKGFDQRPLKPKVIPRDQPSKKGKVLEKKPEFTAPHAEY